jgi:hypothetical protein
MPTIASEFARGGAAVVGERGVGAPFDGGTEQTLEIRSSAVAEDWAQVQLLLRDVLVHLLEHGAARARIEAQALEWRVWLFRTR